MAAGERDTVTTRLAAGVVEYRLEGKGPEVVVVFHGGHMRAGLALGEEAFTASGYQLLVPSRPGYGSTPLTTGTTPDRFADVAAELCRELGIDKVAAVVGMSAGRAGGKPGRRSPHLVRG